MLSNLLKTVTANCASPLNAAANSPRVSNSDGDVPINTEILVSIYSTTDETAVILELDSTDKADDNSESL
jgi:hypothetical protein